MARTPSSMQPLGSIAPAFSLPDVGQSTQNVDLDSYQGRPLLVMFICNHCPFVVHVIEKLVAVVNRQQQSGFTAVAISANDAVAYPQDGPQAMRKFAQKYGFNFPYCYDESQQVAKAYGAECTPDFFVYDAQHKLRYRGQMDGSRPGNEVPVSGADLDQAMSAILSGRAVSGEQLPSIGCNIKWKP